MQQRWTPQSFTSSQKNRVEVKQQSIFNFLDEDEKTEMDGRSLGTSIQFDTFGFTVAEIAHKQAEKEQKQRFSSSYIHLVSYKLILEHLFFQYLGGSKPDSKNLRPSQTFIIL